MKNRVFSVSLVLTSIFSLAWAQNGRTNSDQSRDALCQTVACRPAKTIKLKISKTEIAEFDFPKGPYVKDGYINILAGEEFNVEFDASETKLSNARYVDKISVPEKTVTFKLDQTAEGTVLSVKNPFGQNIEYDCLIQHYQAETLKQTNVLPVRNGLLGLELWPYPITQAVIHNVRFAVSK